MENSEVVNGKELYLKNMLRPLSWKKNKNNITGQKSHHVGENQNQHNSECWP